LRASIYAPVNRRLTWLTGAFSFAPQVDGDESVPSGGRYKLGWSAKPTSRLSAAGRASTLLFRSRGVSFWQDTNSSPVQLKLTAYKDPPALLGVPNPFWLS